MDEPRGVESIDDLLYEIEGARKFEDLLAAAGVDFAEARETRSRGDDRVGAGFGIGRRMIRGSDESTRKRYETLLRLEDLARPDDDHSFLIGIAAPILEAVLDRVVLSRAKSIAEDLIRALHLSGKARPGAIQVVERWAGGGLATIGTASLVLMAIRVGCASRSDAILALLAEEFAPAYRTLLETEGPGRCLSWIGDRYRNPACHGTKSFDPIAYQEFARLVVGNRRFADWDIEGPDPSDADPARAALHHHLKHAPRSEGGGEVESGPIDDLLNLARRGDGSFGIRVEVHPAGGSTTTRDIGPKGIDGTFRLGDAIRFEVEVERSCHLALIEIGTTGAVAVIHPNAWNRDTWIESGRTYQVPSQTSPEIILTGRGGRERIVAIGTSEPLASPLRPGAGSAFRTLSAGEVSGLVAEVVGRGSSWDAKSVEFHVR